MSVGWVTAVNAGTFVQAFAEESPGSMETRCRITSGGGDPRESATESKPLFLAGSPATGSKGERVR